MDITKAGQKVTSGYQNLFYNFQLGIMLLRFGWDIITYHKKEKHTGDITYTYKYTKPQCSVHFINETFGML